MAWVVIQILQRKALARQVCAPSDATDEQIIRAVSLDAPCGTVNGWGPVVRDGDQAPVTCEDDSARTHFVVLC